MLRSRIIPCLLIHDRGLVKTRRFAEPRYLGDPINAVRIFNEKEVDELFVADIDASMRGAEPDYGLIASLAAECRMPLTYAGGVRTVEQVERIVSIGVEKVAIGAASIDTPELISAAATKVGNQSVAVVADVIRRTNGEYEVMTHRGTRATGVMVEGAAYEAEQLGAGEFVINNIDADGMMAGYDLDLVSRCRATTKLPMTVLGGAGSLADISKLIERFSLIGAAAGSLFVFKGRYRAVLLSYPDQELKEKIVKYHVVI